MNDQIDGKAVERLEGVYPDRIALYPDEDDCGKPHCANDIWLDAVNDAEEIEWRQKYGEVRFYIPEAEHLALLSERDALQAQVGELVRKYDTLTRYTEAVESSAEKAEDERDAALAREGAAEKTRDEVLLRLMVLGDHSTDAAAALAWREDEVWDEAIEAAAVKHEKDRGRLDGADRIRALKRSAKETT